MQCDALKAEGAKVASSAADVIKECDVTFAMLADPAAALDVATGADGVASGFKAAADAGSKLYVDVSTVDAGTAQAVCKAVTEAGGRYLEVRAALRAAERAQAQSVHAPGLPFRAA